MFFSTGSPDLQGTARLFVSNATCTNIQFSYTIQPPSAHSDALTQDKLDRILDLLQDQHYAELHKLMGTMTIQEVASYLSKSVRTIERRIEKGLLKAAYKEGNADLFLKKEVVELYVQEYKKWPRQMP